MATRDNNTSTSSAAQLSETMKARLREIDREAADAYISTAAFSQAVRTSTSRPTPVLVGTEKAVLSAAECEVLVHHATTSEAATRRVADAVTEVAFTAERLPSASGAFDPIIADIQNYRRVCRVLEKEVMEDDEAVLLHAEAIQPFAGDIPPMVRSAKGAAEALRLVQSFGDLDHVDANLIAGAIAYLDWRA